MSKSFQVERNLFINILGNLQQNETVQIDLLYNMIKFKLDTGFLLMKCPDRTPRHLKSYKFNQADPTIPYYCWTQLICASTEVNFLCQEDTALGTTHTLFYGR